MTDPDQGPVTQAGKSAVVSAGLTADGEVSGLRTLTSSTFERDGQLVTEFSPVPVNFKQGAAWKPIDNTLVRQAAARAGGAIDVLVNRADEHRVSIPTRSGKPVSLRYGALTVTSTLVGAAAVPVAAKGETATFADVFPGVDEVLTVRPSALEQFFRLRSADATATFDQRVTLPSGYTLSRNETGSLVIADASGKIAGLMPAPVVSDSSRNPDTMVSTEAARFEISGSAPTWTVRTVVDRSWLAAPQRVFPVLVDPTTTVGNNEALGCAIANGGTPDVLCSSSSGTDNSMSNGSTAWTRRILLKFPELTQNTSPIPMDAQVTNAELVMTQQAVSSQTTPIDTEIRQVGADWGSDVTWATQPAVTPTAIQKVNVNPPGNDQAYRFSINSLVQAWVNGRTGNRGLMIKKTDETAKTNTITFYGLANPANRPRLEVAWTPRVGQDKAVGTYDRRLTDRMDLHVSYGSRNLVLNGLDTQFAAPGMPVTVRRTYNSLLAKNGIGGAYGLGWSMSGGVDTGLSITPSGITYNQPGGARAFFQRNVSVASESDAGAFYADRNGLNADLVKANATTYTMTFRKTKTKYTFTTATNNTTAWLSKAEDRYGNATTYAASGSPLVTTKITDSTSKRSIGLTYTNNRVSSMSESLAPGATGARTFSYGYDGSGKLTSYTDADRNVTRFCYTGDLLTRVITPRGAQSGVDCGSSNAANTTDIAYDSAGKVSSVTYRNAAQAPITVSFATTTPLSYPSNTTGRTTFTDALGKTTNYYFDVNNRVTKAVNPLGDTRSSTYNANSDVTASVSAVNYTGGGADPSTTSSFDPNNGNLTQSTLPTGAAVSMTYATSGPQLYQPTKISDDRDADTNGSAATSINYGNNGQVNTVSKGVSTYTTRRQGDSGVTNCGPSGTAAYKGAVCEQRDANYTSGNGNRTLIKYTELGEVASVTPPEPGSGRSAPPAETFTYDGFSRLTKSLNSRGQSTTYTYDQLDRPSIITYHDGSTTRFTYDADGNKLTQTDKDPGGYDTFKVTYTYDALNRLLSEQPSGQNANRVTWDPNSRMSTFTDDSGTLTYSYDFAGDLAGMAQPGGSCDGFSPTAPPTVASGCTIFAVDKDGSRLATIYPGNLARLEYIYDKSSRITRILGRAMNAGTGVTRLDEKYSYDSGGRDTAHLITRDNAINNRRTTYAYSNEGWLQAATSSVLGGSTVTSKSTYCYDKNGNRTLATGSVSATCTTPANASYDKANAMLTGPTGTASDYSFDLDGNETRSGTSLSGANPRTSTWGVRGQNTGVTIAGTNYPNTTFAGGNNYLRQTKTTSTTSQRLRRSITGISAVTTTNGTTDQSTTYIQREPNGKIAGFLTNTGQHYYPMTDRLGSIRLVVDATSDTVAETNYDPYGVATTVTPAPFTQPFGYTGEYTQSASGLVHLSARYYDPTLGRFTQTDPSGKERNAYGYAANDPVNRIDPSGESWGDVLGIVAGAAACAGGGGFTAGLACGALGYAVGNALDAGLEEGDDGDYSPYDSGWIDRQNRINGTYTGNVYEDGTY